MTTCDTNRLNICARRNVTIGAALGPAAVAIAAVIAAAGGAYAMNSPKDPRTLVTTGMNKFRRNQVEESAIDFDEVWQIAPQMRPYLWQRGLSLYYLDRYEEAAAQFRR